MPSLRWLRVLRLANQEIGLIKGSLQACLGHVVERKRKRDGPGQHTAIALSFSLPCVIPSAILHPPPPNHFLAYVRASGRQQAVGTRSNRVDYWIRCTIYSINPKPSPQASPWLQHISPKSSALGCTRAWSSCSRPGIMVKQFGSSCNLYTPSFYVFVLLRVNLFQKTFLFARCFGSSLPQYLEQCAVPHLLSALTLSIVNKFWRSGNGFALLRSISFMHGAKYFQFILSCHLRSANEHIPETKTPFLGFLENETGIFPRRRTARKVWFHTINSIETSDSLTARCC